MKKKGAIENVVSGGLVCLILIFFFDVLLFVRPRTWRAEIWGGGGGKIEVGGGEKRGGRMNA